VLLLGCAVRLLYDGLDMPAEGLDERLGGLFIAEEELVALMGDCGLRVLKMEICDAVSSLDDDSIFRIWGRAGYCDGPSRPPEAAAAAAAADGAGRGENLPGCWDRPDCIVAQLWESSNLGGKFCNLLHLGLGCQDGRRTSDDLRFGAGGKDSITQTSLS
jgi:hypothetical protein